MHIEEYRYWFETTPEECIACGGAPHAQVEGVYVCNQCSESKQTSRYVDNGMLHASFRFGGILVLLEPTAALTHRT